MNSNRDAVRKAFYDKLAEVHHELYRDWRGFCEWQHARIAPYAEIDTTHEVLDASCSIGTQLIPLLGKASRTVGRDLSPKAVARARLALANSATGADAEVEVGDFVSGVGMPEERFDRVLLMDNAISHALDVSKRAAVFANLRVRLRPGGRLVVGLRDYSAALDSRPSSTPPAIYDYGEHKRIVHQVWEWCEDEIYEFHLHIVRCSAAGERSASHFSAFYRAATPAQVAASMVVAGFANPRIVAPEESGYHQYLLVADVS